MNRREAIAALVALPEVSRITVAKPKDDDVLVVECSSYLSQEGAERIKSILGDIWPNRRIIVMSPELRIKFAEG